MLQCSNILPIMLIIMLEIFATVPMFCYFLWIMINLAHQQLAKCKKYLLYIKNLAALSGAVLRGFKPICEIARAPKIHLGIDYREGG